MLPLENKVAIIVGGGRGLGRTIATTLAAQGATIVVAARTRGEIEETADLVRAAGGQALAVQTDATSEQQVRSLADQACAAFGEVDIVVNCAGEAMLKALPDTTWEDWQRILTSNLGTVFLTMREFLPGMIERGRGSIVNITSRAGQYGSAKAGVYGSAKAGVIAFTKAWNKEARPRGVQLAVIGPGPMDTPMRWAATPGFDPKRALPTQVIADMVKLIVTNPTLTFEDVVVPVSMFY